MKNLFEEKQRFTQWWLWVIIAPTTLGILFLFGHGIYQQMILGEPWGDRPMTDEMLVIVSLFSVTAMVVMVIAFFASVLEVVVDKGGVAYKYFPLVRSWRRIEKENVQSFEHHQGLVLSYGIQMDLSGNRTVNVKGRDTIELTMNDGSKLRVGTQRPQEFMSALQAMKNRRIDQ